MSDIANIQKVQDAIRGEFRTLFEKIDSLNSRLSALELWREREEGYKEGIGSLHAEVKELRAKVEVLRHGLADARVQARPGAGLLPIVVGVVGGGIGLVTLISQVIFWLLSRG